jgi:hypothetical protein
VEEKNHRTVADIERNFPEPYASSHTLASRSASKLTRSDHLGFERGAQPSRAGHRQSNR